nr:Chain B, Guanine nucleotide exchange factor SRM1 [Saccharomyces cerevisiae S288C]
GSMVKRTVATNGDASGAHRAKKMSKTH